MDETGFSSTQLQNWMQGMLIRHVPLVTEPAAIERVINPSKRLSAVRHLNIYRHSYIARLRSCMQSQFSALAHALGEELFESFADQYLDAYPSESYTLNTLGERFADFLEQTRPDAGQEQKENWPDFMIELAAFEYALSQIFDETAIENYSMAQPDTPDELLKLMPLIRLFHHRFPVCGYYLEFTQGKSPELPFPEESFCIVTRRQYQLGLFPIRAAQYYFLELMQKGRSVSETKNELIKIFDFNKIELEAAWLEWRKNFIASGFFRV
jgi:hypothetical protein